MYTQKNWWLGLLRGIILLILSFYIFQHPVSALISVAVYIGLSLLFTGVVQILLSFASRGAVENWGWGVVLGIVDIVFGVILMSNPEITAATLPFAIGFWLVFSGAMSFVNSFRSRKQGAPYWWAELISALLSIIVGYMISSNLFVGTFAVTAWLGFGFLMAGIASIVMAFTIKSGVSVE